jgi:hypothetical protein
VFQIHSVVRSQIQQIAVAKLKDNKGFKAGLEELLMDAFGESSEPTTSPTPVPKSPSKPQPPTTSTRRKKPRSASSKSFSSDLSSLFNDSIVESVQERVKQIKQQPKKEKKEKEEPKKEKKNAPRGLDLLIRQTVESSKVDIRREPRRRITFLFEEEKIKRLKDIAQDRQAYIKDIIGDIVSEYIEEYEKDQSPNQK